MHPGISVTIDISDLQRTGPEFRPSTSWINVLPAPVYQKPIFLEAAGTAAFVKAQSHWHPSEGFELSRSGDLYGVTHSF